MEFSFILKENGTIILFGQQPFSSKLVSSNYKQFKYSLVWQKSKPGGFAQAPYKILCEHEDILIFTFVLISNDRQGLKIVGTRCKILKKLDDNC